MSLSLQKLLTALTLISVVKGSEALCENVKGQILCESVSHISSEVLSEIADISDVKRITVLNSPNLTLFTDAFKPAVKLEQLLINYNKIDTIFANTFQSLPVKYLNLGRNEINKINPEAFLNLPSLDKLRLHDNNLEHITVGLFENLQISELVLSKNEISELEDMALKGLPNLTKLKLDNNKLESIFIHKIITYPDRLNILWLHNNSLTSVSNYMLQKLSNLTLLNLGFNQISAIEPNTFEQTPNLNYLILTHNSLKQIDGRIFPRTSMKYLEKIYLDANKLMFLSSNFFLRLVSLKKVTLAGNPWICPCLIEVQKLLMANKIAELCNEEYTSGGRPVCVNENPGDTLCKYFYNEDLSEKYQTYQKMNPLYRPVISCLL